MTQASQDKPQKQHTINETVDTQNEETEDETIKTESSDIQLTSDDSDF